MYFKNLAKKYESTGRITLRGGQCEGRFEVNTSNARANYVQPEGKGSEYAARYRTKPEQERAYLDMKNKSRTQGIARIDVTSGEVSQMEQVEELTSIGTVPNLQELNREELTQVYSRYRFDPVEPSENLETITKQKDKILDIIEGNVVSIISGPTGCGKSTQIPQYILDLYASQKKHCNIVVTQPRRIAAISIAQRVCAERGWGEPGGIVGYQVGLDRKVEEDTRLLYCTTGVLLEKLISDKSLNKYTHIILDEVHEREEDMDFIMLLVKRFLMTDSSNVRVTLMSATIEVQKFTNYFKLYVGNKMYPAPSYTIELERKYSVLLFYLDSLKSIGAKPAIDAVSLEEPKISDEAYNLVPLMIRSFNIIDEEDFKCKRSNEKKGAVLIFLPGLHQIETLYEILLKEDEKQKGYAKPDFLNLWLCPLHSSITKDEQEKVVAYAPKGMRKVILSTNIAESSLTIPDVKYVIDFCLTKQLVADPNTGFSSLQMTWASHTNCVQREGRVGRVQNGRVYRMVPKGFYQFKMSPTSTPEMCRCPLDIVVLKCKRLMEDECPLKIISNAMDPPDLDSYEKTILKLKEIGALLTTTRGVPNPEDGDLTFMGLVMGSLPVDIHISKLIMLGHLFDVLEDAIIMGSAMSVRNIFSEPFRQRLEAYNNKLLWADSSESDSIAYLNAYVVWRQLTAVGKFQRSRGSEAGYGKTYMLQIKHLKEVSMLEDDIKRRLKRFNIQTVRHNNKPLWNKQQTPLILKLVLAGAFYPNYYSCNAQNPNAEIEAIKVLAGQDPYKCVYLQNMAHPAPIYFDQVQKILQENQVSDNFKLHYDTTNKLVVEFNQTSVNTKEVGSHELHGDIPGRIEMPVYRAIKLRQLNIPLSIRTFPPSEARDRLNSLILSSRSSTLGVQSSEYKPTIPWDQQMVEIAVCHVEDAGNFYGHIYPSTLEKLQEVYLLLNKHDLLCELSGEVEDSAIYAAPYRDEGDIDLYYRAKVTRKRKDLAGNVWVNVFFIDYGNSVRDMPAHNLREIIYEEAQKELNTIPPLAVKCVLAEVAPTILNNKGGGWSEEATKFVKETLNSPNARNMWTTQIYSFVNEIASVYLFLKEEGENGCPPLTLNNLLINKGFAKPKEESYLSKRNHAKREEIAHGLQPLHSVEDKNVLKTTSKDLLTLHFSDGKKVHYLKGPYSPLEMKLYSKTRGCCQKEVRVEWNSVNSVLLDPEPTEPYEKLLVAGHVAQSSDKTRLTLNHTTVLPNMNGLAAITCLIFAPTIELRSDYCRSRYIGALCGLGSDPVSGSSYFAENDMEIKFDVEIKNEDLLLINKVRHCMNQRFCNEDSEDMMEHQVLRMQQSIHKLILGLFTTPRHPIKVEHCQSSHCWNLVDDSHLISPFEKTEEQLFINSVYQLIYAIDLDPKRDFDYIQDLVIKVKNLMSCIKRDLQPREFKCDLCDVDYTYWIQLREHTLSGHHMQLVEWLRTRAADHGLTLDIRPSATKQLGHNN